MRWLVPLVLVLSVGTARGAPALVELDVGVVPVVVAISDEADDARHVIAGKVTRIKALGSNIFRITVGRGAAKGSFQVALPPSFELPIRTGDQIRAKLWFADGKLRARVTDRAGAPLVFMNELPAGWSMTIGADTGRPPRGPRHQHLVALTAPGDATATYEGWVRGPIGGTTYRIYAEAAVIDPVAARAEGRTPTWTSSIWSGVVRERP